MDFDCAVQKSENCDIVTLFCFPNWSCDIRPVWRGLGSGRDPREECLECSCCGEHCMVEVQGGLVGLHSGSAACEALCYVFSLCASFSSALWPGTGLECKEEK